MSENKHDSNVNEASSARQRTPSELVLFICSPHYYT